MRREAVYLDNADDVADDVLPLGRIQGETSAVAASDLVIHELAALPDGLETGEIALGVVRGTGRGRQLRSGSLRECWC